MPPFTISWACPAQPPQGNHSRQTPAPPVFHQAVHFLCFVVKYPPRKGRDLNRIEQKLADSLHEISPKRDLVGVGLLLLVAAALAPIWMHNQPIWLDDPEELPSLMTSSYLLPALGFLLVLRCGALDLSVWMAAALGSIVMALVIHHGRIPGAPVPFSLSATAALAAVGAGLLLGLLNAILATRTRLSGTLATLLTATILLLALKLLGPQGPIPLHETTFDTWHLSQTTLIPANGDAPPVAVQEDTPLFRTRKLVVAAIYALVMLMMLLGERTGRTAARPPYRRRLFVSLTVSGALAAAGGMAWLIENRAASLPHFPIDDLRISAAAILAGGAILAGRSRTLLAALLLPFALLVVTYWRQHVWDLDFHGYSLQLLPLIAALVLAAQASLRAMRGDAAERTILAALAGLAGVLLLTVSGAPHTHTVRLVLRYNALALSALSAILLLWPSRPKQNISRRLG